MIVSPAFRKNAWAWGLLALLGLGGCDSQPMDQAYKSHFGGRQGVVVLKQPSEIPAELVASLPVEFQLAHQAGRLTLVLDGAGKIERPTVKIVDFALFAHNRDFISKITELKESGMVGAAPLGFPHVYALRPTGPIEELFEQGAAQRWARLAETYQSLWAEALLLSDRLGRLEQMTRPDILAYLKLRLAGAQRASGYDFAQDPLKDWYEARFERLGPVAGPGRNPWVHPELKQAFEQARDILAHPEKHFERKRARQMRQLRLGLPPLAGATRSLYEQALENPVSLDFVSALGLSVDFDLSAPPYSGPQADFARKALEDALAQAGLLASEPVGLDRAQRRYLLAAFAPTRHGGENLAFDAERRAEEIRSGLLGADAQMGRQLERLRHSLAYMAQRERQEIESRFPEDAALNEKLTQLESAP